MRVQVPPSAPKPTIPEVIDRFLAYYLKNPVWGSLHVVLDDDNLGDSSIRTCIECAIERNDLEAIELGKILLRMSKTQRGKLDRMVNNLKNSRNLHFKRITPG